MVDDYVRGKIKDALAATDNDRHDAQKLLITWAVRDQALLLGMTKAQLKAISAALIEHALRHKDETADTGPDKFPQSTIDDVIAGAGGIPKEKRKNNSVPPPKSTERQATAMRKLAAAFTRKKT
jgi:hypothetical protein